MSNVSKKSIRCAQIILIAICRIAWKSYADFLDMFTAFKAAYTAQYGTDALKAVQAASDMPAESASRGILKALLKKVKAPAKVCAGLCQQVARYIEATFTADLVEAAKTEAGLDAYKEAAGGNWNAMSQLLTTMLQFITNNADTLSGGGMQMPDTFLATFTKAKNAFDAALLAYNEMKGTAKKQTAARASAFQAVYDTLIAMLTDAKTIFLNDKDKQKIFTFAAIKKSVTKDVKTGLHITLTESTDKNPVTDAGFLFQPGNVSAKPNKKGILSVILKPGEYTCTITAPGFKTLQLSNLKTNSGVMHRLKIVLDKESLSAKMN